MKNWRVAKSLEKLLTELNAAFPDRSKISDGSIGDAAHASRNSDHNPWITDSKGVGIVTARDFTNDAKTLSGAKLLDALLGARDRRIKYIIFNRKIYNVKNNFAPEDYHGINAHEHHLHLSVSSDPSLFDDDSSWNLNFNSVLSGSIAGTGVVPGQGAAGDVFAFKNLKRGDQGEAVKRLQERLILLNFLKGYPDGVFGAQTETAVKSVQYAHHLRVDGIVGENTARILGLIK